MYWNNKNETKERKKALKGFTDQLKDLGHQSTVLKSKRESDREREVARGGGDMEKGIIVDVLCYF